MTGDHSKFLFGDRGSRVVVIPQAAARWLYYKAGLRDLRARNTPADPEVNAALIAIALAAIETPGSDPGSDRAAKSEPDRQSTLTTRAAADRLNIGTRAIVKAIAQGRLKAIRHGGRWRIDPDDLDAYR